MTTAPAFQGADRRAQGARAPLPRLRDVLMEQLRATGHALRAPVLIAAALGVLATAAVVVAIASEGAVLNLHAEPSPLPAIVGALLPIAIWAREERFGPGFLWTLPVDRRRHALIKVLAGWLWLMGGVALFALALLVLTLASGGRVLPEETLHILADPLRGRAPLDPAALRTVRWAPGPLIWAVPFTAATATYLLASALALGTRHPLRWVIGTVLLFPALVIASEGVGALLRADWLDNAPERAVSLLIQGRYGLDALLTARTTLLDRRAILTTGERIPVWSSVPELAHWGIATLLWTGIGLLALWAAASRHRERRRA